MHLHASQAHTYTLPVAVWLEVCRTDLQKVPFFSFKSVNLSCKEIVISCVRVLLTYYFKIARYTLQWSLILEPYCGKQGFYLSTKVVKM